MNVYARNPLNSNLKKIMYISLAIISQYGRMWKALLFGLLLPIGSTAATYSLSYSSSQQWANLSNLTPGTHTFKVTNVPGDLDTRWRKSGGVLETDGWAWTYTASFTVSISASDQQVVADFFQDSGSKAYSHNHGWNLAFAPGSPSNPSPVDGQNGTGTYLTFDWADAARATSYDFYLGTSSSNMTKRGSNSSSSYGPVSLSGGTKYYWKVVAKSSGGSATSGTWNFTTSNPPKKPTNPNPSNGATSVSRTIDPSWSNGGGGTERYRVHFGTSSNPPYKTEQTGTSYNPGTLSTALPTIGA